MTGRTAVIIGAGPAGLTAALELVERTDIRPIVIEADTVVGGLARTVVHEGNRIDIGGHRFFSKSDRVMDWWQRILPVQKADPELPGAAEIAYQGGRRRVDLPADGPDPRTDDEVMLVRRRISQILFRGRFFDYPLRLTPATLGKLGPLATARIGASYLRANAWPVRPERSLEDFFINRFGRELYATFFRDYTEKVWGVPCAEIPAEWGAQRVKGLSLTGVVTHALRQLVARDRSIAQKGTATSLVERFLYPKYGPGQMWECVARRVVAGGGEIRMATRAVGLVHDGQRATSVTVEDRAGVRSTVAADHVISTMPLRDLAAALDPAPPAAVAAVSDGLRYRDFITVGLLYDRLEAEGGTTGHELARRLPANWIYVQEPHVRVGRLQIFNNWSPWLVADPATVWVGLEYFCAEGDDLWRRDDADLARLAADEMAALGLARPGAVRTRTVIRMPKTYPAYLGTYAHISALRDWTDRIANLYLVGRNGMHRYNNQDHSMLVAMTTVDNIVAGVTAKDALWAVNTEDAYHEERGGNGDG
jgi:protoporphyrinogen oxidase